MKITQNKIMLVVAGSRLLDVEAVAKLAAPMKRQPTEGLRRKAA